MSASSCLLASSKETDQKSKIGNTSVQSYYRRTVFIGTQTVSLHSNASCVGSVNQRCINMRREKIDLGAEDGISVSLYRAISNMSDQLVQIKKIPVTLLKFTCEN